MLMGRERRDGLEGERDRRGRRGKGRRGEGGTVALTWDLRNVGRAGRGWSWRSAREWQRRGSLPIAGRTTQSSR